MRTSAVFGSAGSVVSPVRAFGKADASSLRGCSSVGQFAGARKSRDGYVRAIWWNHGFPPHPISDVHYYEFCKEKVLAAHFAGDQPSGIECGRPV